MLLKRPDLVQSVWLVATDQTTTVVEIILWVDVGATSIWVQNSPPKIPAVVFSVSTSPFECKLRNRRLWRSAVFVPKASHFAALLWRTPIYWPGSVLVHLSRVEITEAERNRILVLRLRSKFWLFFTVDHFSRCFFWPHRTGTNRCSQWFTVNFSGTPRWLLIQCPTNYFLWVSISFMSEVSSPRVIWIRQGEKSRHRSFTIFENGLSDV